LNSFPKYYDNASTTQIDKRVFDAMIPYFNDFFGNASSSHVYGKESKRAIDNARFQVADLINAESKEIYFTSGATESINWALKGFLEANPEKGNHIITVKTEHKAVLKTCEYLESKGYEFTYLDVNENGLISLEQLENSIQKNTALICIMLVNNEIGVIHDLKTISEIGFKNNVAVFTDATQAVGKIKVDVNELNVDLLCFSGHKLNGPKGIGTLYVKNGIKLTPLIHGGGQENQMRGGTYNTPLIVGLGKACEIVNSEFSSIQNKLNQERIEIIREFEVNNIGIENFKGVNKTPHIISILLNNIDAEEYLMANSNEFVASTGSACNSSLIEISHVIENVFPSEYHNKIIRISI
jgi:cysteine desulfurase